MTAYTDLLVIGAGPAGLSAATMFSRLRRPCIIYDSGVYRNGTSPAAHTIVGFDGVDPAEWRAKARKDLEAYKTCTFRQGKITSLEVLEEGKGFVAKDGEGEEIRGRKVVLATGLMDQLADIPGAREAWGKRLIHCVYCHGTETAFGAMGFLFTRNNKMMNPMLAEALFKHWQHMHHTQVYLLTHGMDINTEEGLKYSGLERFMPLIKAKGYKVISSPIESITSTPESLIFHFKAHEDLSLPYTLAFPEKMLPSPDAAPLLTPQILQGNLTPFGTIPPIDPNSPMGEYIKSHPGMPRMGDDPHTSVPGIYWAGNSGSAMANVTLSVAQGAMAGATAGEELGKEDAERMLQEATGKA